MKTHMLEWFRRKSVRFFTFLMALVACQGYALAAANPATEQSSPRRFLMWKVTSSTTTVYLLGSVHVGTPDLYPLPAAMESAFAASKVLAVEINIKNVDSSSTLELAQGQGMYEDGDSLSKHISKQTSDALDEFCSKNGMPREAMELFKPWLVAMTVTALSVEQGGESQKLGIDLHFLDEVKPPQRIEELESVEFQLSVFASASEQEQQELLASTLKQAENSKESIQKLQEAYIAGDTGKIEEMLQQESEPKSFYKKLIEDRNLRMAEHVENYLKGKEQCFVVVGAGHLVGNQGVVKLLEARNYHVERVIP